MGQKTNPNILRLGKINEWKSKYIEKKTTESSPIIFRDLEIRKFLSQFLTKNGLKIQNCKICYSESSLHVYISYYNSIKPLLIMDKVKIKPKKITSTLFQLKTTKIKKTTTKKQLYIIKTYKKIFSNNLKKRLFKNQYLVDKKTHRLSAIKNFQNYNTKKDYETLNKQNLNLFTSKILKGLSLFTNKKQNIFLNLKQINKETLFLQKVTKTNKSKMLKNLTKLRKFQQNEFFKKGFNLLYNFFTTNWQDPTFLAEFIALFLRKLKRPNFFLRFLKLTLKTLTTEKFAQFERIQIKVKGRFNGAPRATHKFINIGKNIPALTLNSKIDYGEAAAYTANGSFGIKIWTYTSIFKSHHV